MYLSVLINLCMCEDQIIKIYGNVIKKRAFKLLGAISDQVLGHW